MSLKINHTLNSMCSIVSAYYPIKSKFNKNKYMEWGKTFMKLEAPIIFFTEEALVEELSVLREHRPIRFITIPFEEISEISFAGSGNMITKNAINATDFEAKMAGSGDCTLEINAKNINQCVNRTRALGDRSPLL